MPFPPAPPRAFAGTFLFVCLVSLLILGTPHAGFAIDYPGTNVGPISNGGTPTPSCGSPRNVQFNVVGFPGNIGSASVSFTMNPGHTYIGDLVVTLIAPDSTSHVLFGRVGANSSDDTGDSSNMTGTYTFNDFASGNIWTAASVQGNNGIVTPGSYRTQPSGPFSSDSPGPAFSSLNATLVSIPPANVNGTWTLRFQDCSAIDTGGVSAATLTLIPFASAPANISGRVLTSSGKGIRNVMVSVFGGFMTEPKIVSTGSFGYYNFEGLEAGQTYVVSIAAKRYIFDRPSILVNLDQSVEGMNFIAQE